MGIALLGELRTALVRAGYVATAVMVMCGWPGRAIGSDPAPHAGPAGALVPVARDYVRLTPEQRYELRTRARALPEEERREHNRALKAQIDMLPDWIHEALHDERNAMDCVHGTVGSLPSARPVVDGWTYAMRVPTERYELRLRARALTGDERLEYDAQLVRALSVLPAWMRAALEDEAARLDARYGTMQCPGRPADGN